MSHQTGIKCNEKLRETIAETKGKHNQSRLLLIDIDTEKEVLQLRDDQEYKIDSTWQDDFSKYVINSVIEKEPCFMFFRLDSTDISGFSQWVFIHYSPPNCTIRKKMLYASTKATLKEEFGTGIVFDYFADSIDELKFEHFSLWLEEKSSVNAEGDEFESDDLLVPTDSLLTSVEEERRKVRQAEFETSLSKGATKLSNFELPITPEGIEAIKAFAEKKVACIQLRVDIQTEKLLLVKKFAATHPRVKFLQIVYDHKNKDHMSQQLLPSVSSEDDNGFHLLYLKHLDPNSGEPVTKTIFLYILSSNTTSVKARTMHSACLNAFSSALTDQFGVHNIDRRFQLDDMDEFTFDYVFSKFYPELYYDNLDTAQSDFQEKPKFNKPRGPPSRGPRRMIK